MKNAKQYTPEYLLLASIFGAHILTQYGGTKIIVTEFYVGTKTLKEKLLSLMIKELKEERNETK